MQKKNARSENISYCDDRFLEFCIRRKWTLYRVRISLNQTTLLIFNTNNLFTQKLLSLCSKHIKKQCCLFYMYLKTQVYWCVWRFIYIFLFKAEQYSYFRPYKRQISMLWLFTSICKVTMRATYTCISF